VGKCPRNRRFICAVILLFNRSALCCDELLCSLLCGRFICACFGKVALALKTWQRTTTWHIHIRQKAHVFKKKRQLRTEMLPVMSMTPPNMATSSTLTTGTAPLTAPASAGAVVVHEFPWCVFQCFSCCGLSLNHPAPPFSPRSHSYRESIIVRVRVLNHPPFGGGGYEKG
jgi:hypothetical protein